MCGVETQSDRMATDRKGGGDILFMWCSRVCDRFVAEDRTCDGVPVEDTAAASSDSIFSGAHALKRTLIN